MLLDRGFESGGHMAAMGKLLMTGSNLDPSAAEEIARERVALMAVQKEMSEADEANLLEEEDMHVFDQEPLSDQFSLVSCNTCKKPIKVSQYAAHAERCRSLMMSDESALEADGTNNTSRRPLRKSRNGMLGDAEMSLSDEAAADSGVSVSDMQMLGGYSTLKTGKRTMNGGGAELGTAPKVGRPRKLSVYNQRDMADGVGDDCLVAGPSTVLQSEGLSSSGKRRRQYLPFTADDLDVMCGVPSPRSGAPCRQPLTCKSHSISSKRAVAGRRKPFDALLQELKENLLKKAQQPEIPRPLATKMYCSSHHQRMRAVINNLYRESLSGRSSLVHSDQPLALEANPQQQQMLMSLNKGLQ